MVKPAPFSQQEAALLPDAYLNAAVENQPARSAEYREANASQESRDDTLIAKRHPQHLPSSDMTDFAGLTERTAINFVSESMKSEDIQKVLREHYIYGFKLDSIREMTRFRQFADAMNVQLPENDEQLKESILACGIVIDGKLFWKSA